MTKYMNRILIWLLFFCIKSYGQNCAVCSGTASLTDSMVVVINSIDTNNYILSSGKTICIQKSGYLKGNLTVAGGTLCNTGRFVPKSLNLISGSIINASLIILNASFSMPANFNFLNDRSSTLNLLSNATISSNQFQNNGMVNSKYQLNINCNSVINTGIINTASISGQSNVVNTGGGLLNVNQ